MKFAQTTKTSKTHRLSLTGDDIIGLLARSGVNISESAKVKFNVPGGGDWSNTSLDICEEDPIVVSWEEFKQE